MDGEMTDGQLSMIYRLLDQKRVSLKTAAKIIEILIEQPDISDAGLNSPHIKRDTH